jgi:hypothetical protein
MPSMRSTEPVASTTAIEQVEQRPYPIEVKRNGAVLYRRSPLKGVADTQHDRACGTVVAGSGCGLAR